MHRLPRILGALTTAYSVVIVLRPHVLARPCGLAGDDDEVSGGIRTLVGGIGVRDIAIGSAMMFAPPGPALRAAVAARVFSDAADAVVFGTRLPEPARRPRIAAFAVFWATLCAVSVRWAG